MRASVRVVGIWVVVMMGLTAWTSAGVLGLGTDHAPQRGLVESSGTHNHAIGSVTFSLETFSVTFTESGIPTKTLAKTGWAVELNGTVKYSLTTTINFSGVPNGTDPVLIVGPSGYTASGSGRLTVSGTTSVSVTFAKGNTETLRFSEKGLPKGQLWCTAVDDDRQCSVTASMKYTNLTPGNYSYAVVSPLSGQTITAKVGTMVVAPSGSLDVTKSTTVALKFAYLYAVTFTETGLVNETWSVTIKGVTMSSGSGGPIVFHLVNGTYAYRIGKIPGYTSSGSPKRVVVPTAVSLAVTFTPKIGTSRSYTLGMVAGSATGSGTRYVVVLALIPSTGLSTSVLGLTVRSQVNATFAPPLAPPLACHAYALPTTCGSVSGGWYAALVAENGTVIAAYGSSGWTGFASGVTSVVLTPADSLWVITPTLYDGMGYVLSAFGTDSVSVSGTAIL
jgi:hypothetical protein